MPPWPLRTCARQMWMRDSVLRYMRPWRPEQHAQQLHLGPYTGLEQYKHPCRARGGDGTYRERPGSCTYTPCLLPCCPPAGTAQ